MALSNIKHLISSNVKHIGPSKCKQMAILLRPYVLFTGMRQLPSEHHARLLLEDQPVMTSIPW